MNANGRASSFRFSAKWKQTRPTWCQLGARVRSNASSPPAAGTVSRTHAFRCVQTRCRQSAERYSPPCIGGAARIQAAHSAGVGGSTCVRVSCSGSWHRAVR